MAYDFVDRLYDYHVGRKKAKARRLAMELGIKLTSKMDVATALERISGDEISANDLEKLKTAATRIRQGVDVATALENRGIYLSARDKCVLGMPIPDYIKGVILKSWSEQKKEPAEFGTKMVIFTLLVFASVIVSYFLFVFPMFRQISIDLNLNYPLWLSFLSRFVSIFGDGKAYILIVPLLASFFYFIISVTKCSNNVKKLSEESDFLNIISGLDAEYRWKLIGHLGNKVCFPVSFKVFNKLSSAINNGENIEEAIAKSGVTPQLAWLLQLSRYDDSRNLLKEGAVLLSERALYFEESANRLAEILILLLETSVFAAFALYMFGSMNMFISGILVGL